MNTLLKWSIIILVVAVVGVIWGYQYMAGHPGAAFGSLMGQSDPSYQMAGWALFGGVVAFLVGIGLLIGGLVQQNRRV
jgi:hypothetical protein